MEEEWDNDICCATCRYGYLVEDVNEGEKIHCKKKDEYMPTESQPARAVWIEMYKASDSLLG